MAEVLSQQEIDLLLKSGGDALPVEVQDHEAVLFDFRLPNRISKNQLRTIRNIHENFAESFSSFLVTKLQSIVNINIPTVDQIYYSEYVLSVPNPACLYTFEIKNTDIKGILELSIDFALTLVDRLLGGNGFGTKQTKMITPIEQKVLQVVIERIFGDLRKAWQIIDDFEFIIDRFEPDIDFAQITSQNESVLLLSFEILIGEQSYLMNLSFATFAFDTILAKLSSQKLSTIRPVRYQGVTAQDIITSHLYKTVLPISVEFGKTVISVNELMNLEVGDVIMLETKVGDEHTVKIQNRPMFMGRSGNVNNHKAIKITQRLTSNEKK
ncbi:MAG: flagellar motor switch protein FliM [Ignavibacteriaceae bacterium]|nr:flagellar motor switch protein FliM [Ignavibacteriaceae bacterium]HRI45499.1 flagellar motor switch protein FliM [Ignavibacteriaceae bacterium]